MKSDIEIAQENEMLEIEEIAKKINVPLEYLERYGDDKAKINLKINDKIKDNDNGKFILVSSINPTSAGEGKSTITIGLVEALNQIGYQTMGCIRQPSLGPVFGMKGGATGGGYAQVVPMADINLHFTGDIHAITSANALIAACIDNHLYHGNELGIDPEKITFKRVVDMNDRSLRCIEVGLNNNGVVRKDGFDISVASEIMAILCLSLDLDDFKERVGKIIVAYTNDDTPVFVDDLKISGAIALLMKDAIKPNLVQTLEHNPILIHGGPFANIAHGTNSLIADRLALKLSDYVISEAGFGADLGCEKFIDIVCPAGDLAPDCIVIVVSIKALKLHGGVDKDSLKEENIDALLKGCANLEKHLDSIKTYGIPCVVALNKFNYDSDSEITTLKQWCADYGVECQEADVFAKGGSGGLDLARACISACNQSSAMNTLYDYQDDFIVKLDKVVQKAYGGNKAVLSDEALKDLERLKEMNLDKLPLCIAKTPASLSDDASKIGRPQDFDIHVKSLRVANGAGFIIVITGNIMSMPGLPKVPAAENMDILEDGSIIGLF